MRLSFPVTTLSVCVYIAEIYPSKARKIEDIRAPLYLNAAYPSLWRVVLCFQVLIDANTRDKEDVPLLHWAAINDRQAIVSYLLKKVGGQLQCKPFRTFRKRLPSLVVRAGKEASARFSRQLSPC